MIRGGLRSLGVALSVLACTPQPTLQPSPTKTATYGAPVAALETTEDPAATPRGESATANRPVQIRVSVDSERAIDRAATGAIEREEIPGSVVLIGGREGLLFERAYGNLAVQPHPEPMVTDAIFDLASLTKVFTAAAILRLVELDRLELETDVGRFFPVQQGRTLEDLLLHRSGLPAVDALRNYGTERGADIDRIASIVPAAPGHYVYSDLGFILLGEIVSRVYGDTLPSAIEGLVAQPLGLGVRFFAQPPADLARVVPTEFAPRRADGDEVPMIRGQVHDPRAYRLGGVAGHAGLFGTARDVASLVARLVTDSPNTNWLSPTLRHRWLRRLTLASAHGPQIRRALSLEAIGEGVGHRGYTGTFFYADPTTGRYVVVLSSRVHPDGQGDAEPLRQELIAVLEGLEEAGSPSEVQTGIDVLRSRAFSDLTGQRVALFTHDPARARDGQTTRVLFEQASAAGRFELSVLFAPEHGFGADQEGAIAHGESAGVPRYSLFGPERDPPAEAFEKFDTLVIDVQDVGVRFYTYLSSMHRLLRAAAQHQTPVWILDRPNPLGTAIVGPLSSPAHRSFVNHHSLPIQHGLTAGEMALLLRAEDELNLDLQVIEVQGWSGEPWDEIGRRWVAPSPNLPTTAALGLYPGVALVEGANISVGRGTASPFQLVGAPYIDAERLRDALGAMGIATMVRDFRPTTSRFRGQTCHGIFLPRTSEHGAVHLGMALLAALAAEDEFDAGAARALVADDEVFARAVEGGLGRGFGEAEARFRVRSAAFWRYPRATAR